MKKTIEWQTKSGKAARVEIELETSRTINADGDRVTVACAEMHITATVDNMYVGGGHIEHYRQTVQGVEVAGQIGKLYIPVAPMAEIDAAIAEIHSTPEWQAKVARQQAGEKTEKEYQTHLSTMRRAMRE